MCYWYCHCNNNTYKKPDFNRCFYFTKISVALSSNSVNPCKIFSVYSCKRYTSVNLWGAGWEKWDVDLLIHSIYWLTLIPYKHFPCVYGMALGITLGLGFLPARKSSLVHTFMQVGWRGTSEIKKNGRVVVKTKGGSSSFGSSCLSGRSFSIVVKRSSWVGFLQGV